MSNTTITDKQIERFTRIDAAYMEALNGRDAETVSILDLLPAIFDAVPDTSPEEIEARCDGRLTRQWKKPTSLGATTRPNPATPASTRSPETAHCLLRQHKKRRHDPPRRPPCRTR